MDWATVLSAGGIALALFGGLWAVMRHLLKQTDEHTDKRIAQTDKRIEDGQRAAESAHQETKNQLTELRDYHVRHLEGHAKQ